MKYLSFFIFQLLIVISLFSTQPTKEKEFDLVAVLSKLDSCVPTLSSDDQTLDQSSATICIGQSVTLSFDKFPMVNWEWSGPNGLTAIGPKLIIEDFSLKKAGIYQASFFSTEGKKTTKSFELKHLDLGEDFRTCGKNTLSFHLPEGPSYKWSNGSESNSFTVTFKSSAIIAVEAITEFGCVIKDDLKVVIDESIAEIIHLAVKRFDEAYPVCAPVGFDSYVWSNNATGIINNFIPSKKENLLILKASNNGGCINTFVYHFDLQPDFDFDKKPIDIATASLAKDKSNMQSDMMKI